MKRFLAVVCGVVTGVAIVACGDAVVSYLYPLPPGLKIDDKVAFQEYVSNIPAQLLALMLCFWLLSSLAGGLVAALINPAEWRRASTVTGSILLVAAILNMLGVPHPLWMWAVAVLLYLPAARLGGMLGGRRKTAVR